MKRLPNSALPVKTVERGVKFIKNVAEEQVLLLPGHVLGFKRINLKLLLSNRTKHSLWKTYFHVNNKVFILDKKKMKNIVIPVVKRA